MTSPISHIASRIIGRVESVSPDEICILLDIDAPQSVALNTGIPTPFPRINGFVLLPNESGAVVGVVTWIGIERAAPPRRQGMKSMEVIELPFPLRKMTISPLGTLISDRNTWRLERGVQSFPSVGDTAVLPTREQVISIVTGRGNDGRVVLGTCPIAHDAPVSIDPDKLFGRHLAVLGNTGSGKSCTVAALVRASIESAQRSISSHPERNSSSHYQGPNARFIILDPNGEYSRCFSDLGSGCRVFRVPPITGDPAEALTIPAWMWNSSEWAAVAQAAPRAQRPLLQEALRNLRSGVQASMSADSRLFARCKHENGFLAQFIGQGAVGFPSNSNCGQQLSRFVEDLRHYAPGLSNSVKSSVEDAISGIESILNSRAWNNRQGFSDFGDTDLVNIGDLVNSILSELPTSIADAQVNEDLPLEFNTGDLAEHLEALAMQEGGPTSQFISTLTMRIRGVLSDTRMNAVINPESAGTLSDWLEKHIGSDKGENGSVVVIDLSLVPYEILHLVISVASRLILESLQRYRKVNRRILPTVLVLEEAHTFVAKHHPRSDEIPNPADMCRSIFERIAREGRKFGLGLVLSSQRPSELSETVLAQCNSFLLHRITNDKDQELISRLVPDNTRGMLRELPSLPTRHCILLGIASMVPTLTRIHDLRESQRPESEDPDFWDVWTNKTQRPANWKDVVDDWVGFNSEGEHVISNSDVTAKDDYQYDDTIPF